LKKSTRNGVPGPCSKTSMREKCELGMRTWGENVDELCLNRGVICSFGTPKVVRWRKEDENVGANVPFKKPNMNIGLQRRSRKKRPSCSLGGRSGVDRRVNKFGQGAEVLSHTDRPVGSCVGVQEVRAIRKGGKFA